MSDSETYVIRRKGGPNEARRCSPTDALYVYSVFQGKYGKENVELGVERITYETISPEDLRQKAQEGQSGRF